MQCFICVTYMFFICSAYPRPEDSHKERSLFHDVIESLQIRAQLPEDTNRNEENNLGQIYDRYGYENDGLNLPNDAEFIPRRNDRIALPPLKYRLPKMLSANETETSAAPKDPGVSKDEIVVFTSSTTEIPKISTQKIKMKTTKQPNKKKPTVGQDDGNKTIKVPIVNTMADQSHIGNKEIHMDITPNIVLNFNSKEDNKDSFIKFEEGKNASDTSREIIPQNIFNIHQEINLEKDITGELKRDHFSVLKKLKQDVQVMTREDKTGKEENMVLYGTTAGVPENCRKGRKLKNVLQILLSL